MELKIDVDTLMNKILDDSIDSQGVGISEIAYSFGTTDAVLTYGKESTITVDEDVVKENMAVDVPSAVYDELRQARSVMGYFKHLVDKDAYIGLTEEEVASYNWIREDEDRFFRAMIYGMVRKEQLYYVYIPEADGHRNGLRGYLNQLLDQTLISEHGSELFIGSKDNLGSYRTKFTEEEIKELPKGKVWWEFRKPAEEEQDDE